MQCITEAALADLALTVVSRTATTAGTKRSTEHVESCEGCSRLFATHLAVARAVDGFSRVPAERELRRDCLDENALAEFVDNVMTENERDDAMHHLTRCQDCVSQLSGLATSLRSAEPSTLSYVFKRVRDGLDLLLHPEEGFTLVSHEPAVVLEANAQGLSVYSWLQQTGDYSVQFDLQELENGSYSVQLTLSQQEASSDQARLIVRVDGNIVQAQPLPASGKTRLDGLSAQTYDIEIVFPDHAIGPFELAIE